MAASRPGLLAEASEGTAEGGSDSVKAGGDACLGVAGFSGHAAGPLDAEEAEGEGHDDDTYGEAGYAVGEGEVGVLAGGDHVGEQGEDGEEGGEEKGCHTGGDSHEERLEPA